MNIALPILLLVFGGLSFWLLTESSLKWYFKTACISAFCIFTIIFWSTIHTFLGWPAQEKYVPKRILIHWVIIKEPNEAGQFDGAIYILIESVDKIKSNEISELFGYSSNGKIEPRLFELKYNRKLHEKLQKIKAKLKRGQPVVGRLTKEGGEGKKSGEGKSGKKGGGSESQEQDWQFHELSPSDIQGKPNE